MKNTLSISPEIFIRAPFYSFLKYDPDRLPQVLKDPPFQNALYLASRQFYEVLEKKDFEFSSLSDKERFTVFKYYNRMCFRPTPFGGFASFGTCQGEPAGKIFLADAKDTCLHLLSDQKILVKSRQSKKIGKDTHLCFNPTINIVGGEIRFVRSLIATNGKYEYELAVLEHQYLYQALFAKFGNCVIGLLPLKDWIREIAGCSHKEALAQILFLLEEQLLLADGEVSPIYSEGSVTGRTDDALGLFHAIISPAGRNAVKRQTAKLSFQASKLGIRHDEPLFYSGMERKVISGNITVQDRDELTRAVTALEQLTTPVTIPDLEKFIQKFTEKYDRRTVPLLEALDPDLGISYGNLAVPALDLMDNGILSGKDERPDSYQEWTVVHDLLMRLWTNGTRDDNYRPIIITEKDLPAAAIHNRKMPPGMPLMFYRSEEHLVIGQAAGVTPVSLIARFSAFSEHVQALIRTIAEAESLAHPAVIFADIGILTDLHVDNINRRGRAYEHEIPINTYYDATDALKIPPSDLLVSVRNGEIILVSAKLGKRVIPRLCSAYNFKNNDLAIFRFLCDLQFQGVQATLNLSLENLFPGRSYYPRVQYGNTVLSLAKWDLMTDDLDRLKKTSQADLHTEIQQLRERFHWPRHISVGENDQTLVFDLASRDENAYLFHFIQKATRLTITEYLRPDNSVRCGNYPHAAQFIALLKNDEKQESRIHNIDGIVQRTGDRDHVPGSCWVYFKIYAPSSVSDELIRELISPYLKEHHKAITTWFYIRYNDPDPHLRFRLYADIKDTALLIAAFREFYERYEKKNLINEFQLATYKQEIERYGQRYITLVEHIFHQGSELVLANLLSGEHGLSQFELGLISAWHMLTAFFDRPETKQAFLNMVYSGFAREFDLDKKAKISLDLLFREKRDLLDSLVSGQGPGQIGHELKKLALAVRSLRDLSAEDTPDRKNELLADIIHMQMNRNFQYDQRRQEMISYHMLIRFLAFKTALGKLSDRTII